MSLRVTFLGSGGSVPTPKRNLPSILVSRNDEQIMFDCGEGVQRQMVKAGGGFHRRMKIFITHMHGDHVLGLPGLLQTMALLDRKRKLEIFGPLGLECFLKCIQNTVQFVLTFPVEIHEIEDAGRICEESEYEVDAIWASHVIPSLSFALVEKPRPGKFNPEKAKQLGIAEGPLWAKLQRGRRIKLQNGKTIEPELVVGPPRQGRKIVYTGDTRPFKELVQLAANADLLIHEATLDDILATRAKTDGHSTPSQAARTAKKSKTKHLILTHISARYDDTSQLLKHAKKIFSNTRVAEDFLEVEIPLSNC